MLKNSYKPVEISFESIERGRILPSMTFKVNTSHVFMFSAVTWNRHRIHYDQNEAKREGHSDILVQRGLIGNLFVRYVNAVFPHIFISSLDWKVLSSATPGQEMDCQGVVATVDGEADPVLVELSLTLSTGGRIVSEASVKFRMIEESDLTKPLV